MKAPTRPGTRQSAINVGMASKEVRSTINRLWAIAPRAPIFCKETKRRTADGHARVLRRTSHPVSSQAFKIAASAAAAAFSHAVGVECRQLRLDLPLEKRTCAWLPSISPGARLMLEQFMTALAQEAGYKAHAYRRSASRKHAPTRLGRAHLRAGWEATLDRVFADATPAPAACLLPLVALESAKPATRKSRAKAAPKAAEGDDDDKAACGA